MSAQVANALSKGVPIVMPTFFADYETCQATKQILPDPRQFIPTLSEKTINVNEVSLAVNKERQQVGPKSLVKLSANVATF